jgi:hypothetical protein
VRESSDIRPEIHFDRTRTCTAGMNIERSTLTNGSLVGSLVAGSARVGNRVRTYEKSDVSSRVSSVCLNDPLCSRERVHASASAAAQSQGVISMPNGELKLPAADSADSSLRPPEGRRPSDFWSAVNAQGG